MNKIARTVWLLVFCIAAFRDCPASTFRDYTQVAGIMHISSNISDGKLSIPEIALKAKEEGIGVVILTDRYAMKWEYGLWPLRRLIKKTVEEGSISRFGAKKYLELIDRVRKDYPGILIIAGVESAPFYYWEGGPWSKGLKIIDWHKHLLAFGFNDAESLSKLPVIGNPSGLRQGVFLFSFWPFLLMLLGIFMYNKRVCDYKDHCGRQLAARDKRCRAIGLLMVFIGAIFLLNNYPFKKVMFDQYGGDRGEIPYQNFIDYVNGIGGIVFWAHPEASNVARYAGIKVETRKHPDSLLKTKDYCGFCVFYEGYREVGSNYGIWDDLLMQYCRGERALPVWAAGGLSFDSSGRLEDYINDLRNMLLLKNKGIPEVMQAFKRGRLYVVNGARSKEFILEDFTLTGENGAASATMGEEIVASGKVRINIRGRFNAGDDIGLQINLIRDKELIGSYNTDTPFNIEHEDDPGEKGMHYYRLELCAASLRVVSNPIFVRRP